MDFVIVLLDVVAEFASLVGGSTNCATVSALRIIRLIRLAPAVKVMMKFPELHDLVKCMGSAARITMWGSLFICAAIVVWAIVAVQLVYPIALEITPCQRCPQAWQSVWHAVCTLTQLLVSNDGWGDICDPIIRHAPWALFLFGAMLFSAQLLMLNLVLAVIVQYANMEHEKDKEVKEHRVRLQRAAKHARIVKALESVDTDGNGSISREELVNNMSANPDVATEFSLGIETSEMPTVFDLLDNEGKCEVEYKNFVANLQQLQTYNPLNSTIVILQQFKLLRDHLYHLSCSFGGPRHDVANEGILSHEPSQDVFNCKPGSTDTACTQGTPPSFCAVEQNLSHGLPSESPDLCAPQQAQGVVPEEMAEATQGDAKVSCTRVGL